MFAKWTRPHGPDDAETWTETDEAPSLNPWELRHDPPPVLISEPMVFNPHRTMLGKGEWEENFKPDTIHDALTASPSPKGPPLILSTADSPVRTYRSQATEQDSVAAVAVCGLSSSACCPSCGLSGFVSRMSAGLLSSSHGRDFGTILAALDDLGYGVAWAVLDARWFGIPQRRRRVFLVGCLGDSARAAQVLAVCESCGGHPAPRGGEREDVAASLTGGSHSPGVHIPGRRKEDDVNLVIAGPLGSHHGNVRADQAWTGQLVSAPERGDETLVVANTLNVGGHSTDPLNETLLVASSPRAAGGHHGHSSPRGDGADNLIAFQPNSSRTDDSGAMGVRRLTPRECERLQGWPDDWTKWTADGREIPDSHRYRMVGNGVASPVAEWIGHRLMAVDALTKEIAA